MKTENILGLDIPVEIQSYKRSKSLKIYVKDGYIKVTKPIWYSKSNTIEYIKKNKPQIIEMYNAGMQKFKEKEKITNIQYILYKGQRCSLYVYIGENISSVNIDEEKICVYVSSKVKEENIENTIKKLIKERYILELKKQVEIELEKYCKLMKISVPHFRIKDCKTIWGSCSARKNLNFNYRIIMMPNEVMESIIVHELCHIKHMNHGNLFWKDVYTYYGKEQYEYSKQWIKRNSELINII